MSPTRSVRTLIVSLSVMVLALVVSPAAREAEGSVREFDVVAKKYEWQPARFEVDQGDTVRFVVHSTDSTHGFGIKQLKVKREIPKSGEPVTIEVVASEPGEFEITCSEWCGKGHKTMKGVLVVRPRAGTR